MAEVADTNAAATAPTEPAPAGTTGQSVEQTAASPSDFGNPFGEPASVQTQAEQQQGANAPEQRPAMPDKYTFNLPQGLEMSPGLEARFTEIAHGIGLTQEQADGLIKIHSDIMLERDRQAETIKAQWAAESKHQGLLSPEKTRLAASTVRTFTDSPAEAQELMNDLVESGVAFKPNVQKFLQLIGSYLQEDSAPDGKDASKGQSVADLLFPNSKYY